MERAYCDDGTPMATAWFEPESGAPSAPAYVCPTEPEAAAAAPPVVITSAMVLRALREVPLPESVLVVQPPGGRTLVNFETNFYTEAEEFTRTVRLAGQRVDLRIRPSGFGWHFGDGASLSTTSAGSPFPDLEVTHSYRRRGAVGARVDTTYSADFRVNGGPWQAVEGTVTMAGQSVGLQVLTASPTLVGYR